MTNISTVIGSRIFIAAMVFPGLFCKPSLAADSPATSDPAALVNPLIGTDRGGATFPGAVAPFGMMQLTPNLANHGYFYTDTHMDGFVVNMMSGAGGGNEGQVLITATTGPVKIDRASTDFTFDHRHESASPGYYRVLMQPWNINAELTTSTRCGMIRFTFPAGKQSNILLPVSYANNPVLSSHVHFVDDRTVTGDVTSENFVGVGKHKGIKVYFVMVFSKPFAGHGVWSGTTMKDGQGDAAQNNTNAPAIGFYGTYPAAAAPQVVNVRIGMSYVDAAGAMTNLNTEMPGGTFDHYRSLAHEAWNRELNVIKVEGGTRTHDRIFYTALYHALIDPTIFDDADGRYRGFDHRIHRVPSGHRHLYATYSGWDIYRTEMPLLAIIEPQRAQDMAQSIVEMAKQIGFIDRWPQLNKACTVMNGNPLTICLVNFWNAGLHDFDINAAYAVMFKQALPGNPHSHIGVYEGFAEEKHGVTINADASVSSALEYDLSFAALGHLAESLHKFDDMNYLYGRAFQYREMYNPQTGFLQGRNAFGRWDRSFRGYTEGDKWLYLWFVPEDVQGLVDLIGGPATFDRRLDEFFHDNHYDPHNEPDLQTPFLYDYIDRPWKTQHLVAGIADKEFTDSPGGLAGGGNDDLGTMSSWYILSQLGFYPVDPGIPDFEVCTPRFPKIVIHLCAPHSGKQFVIETPQASPTNEYIQSATLNGKPLTKPWFPESAITGGGVWTVQVGPEPNRHWATSPFDRPYSLSTGYDHIPPNPIVKVVIPTAQSAPVTWRYTTVRPAKDWYQPDFADAGWRQGEAGFGTDDQSVKPRTRWTTEDIWMRRTFTLSSGADYRAPAFWTYHDQDIEVYVNGVPAAKATGWVHSYVLLAMTRQARATLHPGTNTLAVHVHHVGEGRHFADVGIVELQWPESEK